MDDGTVAGIDVSSGHLVWKTRLVTGPIGAFVPAGDLLVTTSNSSRGAIVAFRRDPSGALLDEPSPTELDLPTALLNFAGSFVLVLGLLILLFRMVIRPRPTTEVTYVPGSIDGEGERPAPGSGSRVDTGEAIDHWQDGGTTRSTGKADVDGQEEEA
jgi:hypothetical protein